MVTQTLSSEANLCRGFSIFLHTLPASQLPTPTPASSREISPSVQISFRLGHSNLRIAFARSLDS